MLSINFTLRSTGLVLLAVAAACSDTPTTPRATSPLAPGASAALGAKPGDGLLVYSGAAGGGGPQLYSYNMTTHTERQITKYFSPTHDVSADGKRVVAIGPNLEGLGGTDLWIMNIDGTKPDTITSRNFKFVDSPSFSPDGKRVVFTAKDTVANQDHLWMLDLKTRVLTALGDPAKAGYDPEFSPDGSSIVFTGYVADVTPTPMLMNPAGTIIQQLPNICPAGRHCWDATWSPDGKLIAFATTDEEIMIYDVATKSSTLFATEAATPAWSPDGTRLAYSRRLPLETPVEKSGIFVRGVTVDLQETPVVKYTGFVWSLTWTK